MMFRVSWRPIAAVPPGLLRVRNRGAAALRFGVVRIARFAAGATKECRKVPSKSQSGAHSVMMVEPRGIEPLTSSLRTTRSPS